MPGDDSDRNPVSCIPVIAASIIAGDIHARNGAAHDSTCREGAAAYISTTDIMGKHAALGIFKVRSSRTVHTGLVMMSRAFIVRSCAQASGILLHREYCAYVRARLARPYSPHKEQQVGC